MGPAIIIQSSPAKEEEGIKVEVETKKEKNNAA